VTCALSSRLIPERLTGRLLKPLVPQSMTPFTHLKRIGDMTRSKEWNASAQPGPVECHGMTRWLDIQVSE
jgi:hypothetical protein